MNKLDVSDGVGISSVACNLQEEAIRSIKNLPFVQSEQRWIPCSERLPEDDALMIVNYIDNRPEAMDIWIGWHEMENVWYIDGEAHSKEYGNEVIAWMPLPQPYKGGNRWLTQ